MRLIFAILALSLLALSACADTVTDKPAARILVMGDSLMTWHGISDRAVPDVLERELGEPVVNRATTAARMIYKLPISGAAGLNIPKQFRAGPWDWVIVNGGGNDLWLGCRCHKCAGRLNRLISPDSDAGVIPDLLMRLRDSGARVIFVGYLRTPGRNSPIEACRDEGGELEARVAEFAAQRNGVHFASLQDLVPEGDLSFHTLDRIHPSVKGSKAIAARIAAIIRDNR